MSEDKSNKSDNSQVEDFEQLVKRRDTLKEDLFSGDGYEPSPEEQLSMLEPEADLDITEFRRPTKYSLEQMKPKHSQFRAETACCDTNWDCQYIRMLYPWERRYADFEDEYADFAAVVVVHPARESPMIPTIGIIEIRENGETRLYNQATETGYHRVTGLAEIPSGESGFEASPKVLED